MKKNCWKLKEDKKGYDIKDDDTKSTTSAIASDGEVFTGEATCLHGVCQDTEWVVDTGSSYHLTSRRDFFATYKSGDFGMVKMGNNSQSQIVGVGDVYLQTNTGCTLILRNVRHVPDLRLNLISGLELDNDGYESRFAKGAWKLVKGSLIVARGKACCTLYITQAKVVKGEVNAIEDASSSNLWHRRLGHMSVKGMQILHKEKLLPDIKGICLDSCDDCIIGKQHKLSFQKHLDRSTCILDLVHSDVCGPMKYESLGGSWYFVTFIDDFSRKLWVFTMKSKDQVFDIFKHFHAMVERETGKKLKCIRTDNGGEYTSRMFEAYCKEHGIKHQKTVPMNPQQNGVAERMNRTIVERIRSMLSSAKLPKAFWGEAMRTACYLINRSPSLALNGDVPERVWTGKDVSYSHLRVFGCKAFVHVPREQRSKLDDKAVPCIFLGYGDEEFGYRLWDPEKRRIQRSRDVIFHEDLTIDDFEKGKSQEQSEKIDLVPTLVPSPLPMQHVEEVEEVQDGHNEEVDGGDIPDEEGVEQGEPIIQEEHVEPQLRRSTRERQPSTRYSSAEYLLLSDAGEPECIEEVKAHKEREKWQQAMQEEMSSLQKNKTYELVELPKERKALQNKWVFKVKNDDSGNVKYKARLVVKGFGQKKGIDFDEIFAPVVKMSSIRTVLGLAAGLDLEIEQLDVKTAFLHGDLKEEIYMKQPEGFEIKGKEHLVCKLKKSLYGLKQAPRQWYRKFDSFMRSQGYKRTFADHCVYVRRFSNNDFIILLLYVDDMLIVGKDKGKINRLKSELSKSFDMKDLGQARQILGMNISRDRKSKKLWLSQEKYIERVLEKFNMKDAKPVSTPLANHFKLNAKKCPTTEKERKSMASIPYSSAVGSLMYAMVCTRPDIAYAVGVVSRYLANPGKEHWRAVQWIFRYLKGTSNVCLCFGGNGPVLEGYVDADMAGDLDSRKSTSGYVFTFAGGAVSWQSRLQKCVALSTTEAEYIAATEAGKDLLWIKRFLQELGLKQENYVIHCDSQSAIDLSKNTTYHCRTKHIDVRYHWIRDAIENEEMRIVKIHTDENPADMMTKVISKEKQSLCRNLVNLSAR